MHNWWVFPKPVMYCLNRTFIPVLQHYTSTHHFHSSLPGVATYTTVCTAAARWPRNVWLPA